MKEGKEWLGGADCGLSALDHKDRWADRMGNVDGKKISLRIFETLIVLDFGDCSVCEVQWSGEDKTDPYVGVQASGTFSERDGLWVRLGALHCGKRRWSAEDKQQTSL